MTLSVAAICNLSLPDSIINGIIIRSNTYAKARTKLDEMILVDSVMKRNLRWMHPNKYQDISQQDILVSFLLCFLLLHGKLSFTSKTRLLGTTSTQLLPPSSLDGRSAFVCDKFEYVWRNILLNSLLTDEEIDNSVEVDNDGQFKPETEPE